MTETVTAEDVRHQLDLVLAAGPPRDIDRAAIVAEIMATLQVEDDCYVTSHVLPVGSMDRFGEYDWSRTEVTACVTEDGLWIVQNDDGAVWAQGFASSVSAAFGAIAAAVT